MKSSIGALWVFSIVITFIMIFVAYLAVTDNYAKAFKIKNEIISIIENNEGVIDGDYSIFNNTDEYLISNGYDAYGDCDNVFDLGEDAWVHDSHDWELVPVDIFPNGAGKNGVCIYKKEFQDSASNGFCQKNYYRVVTFFKIDLPYLGEMLTFSVNGNSKPIYDRANYNCVNP